MMMEMESWPGGAADGLNEMDLGGGGASRNQANTCEST